jgi:hypothetical protein
VTRRGSQPEVPQAAENVSSVGYHDRGRLYALDEAGSFFVTRTKDNIPARRVYSAPVDRSAGLICVQQLLRRPRLPGTNAAYPLSRLRAAQEFRLPDQPSRAVVADDLRAVQKSRAGGTVFQVDKAASANQTLLRHSENAVKTQLWIAVRVYVLVVIIKRELKLNASLDTL